MSFFFPDRCAFCRCVIKSGELLCERCEKADVRDDAVSYLNLKNKMKSIQCFSPYIYKDPVKKSLHMLKFRNCPDIAKFFAFRISQTAKATGILDFDLITPVPLSEKRKKERGYNQSFLIARELSLILGIPCVETLLKIKDNRKQHTLRLMERKENVRGVYKTEREDLHGKRILLVDDIITTGYTVSECAHELLKAGAAEVICASGARA